MEQDDADFTTAEEYNALVLILGSKCILGPVPSDPVLKKVRDKLKSLPTRFHADFVVPDLDSIKVMSNKLYICGKICHIPSALGKSKALAAHKNVVEMDDIGSFYKDIGLRWDGHLALNNFDYVPRAFTDNEKFIMQSSGAKYDLTKGRPQCIFVHHSLESRRSSCLVEGYRPLYFSFGEKIDRMMLILRHVKNNGDVPLPLEATFNTTLFHNTTDPSLTYPFNPYFLTTTSPWYPDLLAGKHSVATIACNQFSMINVNTEDGTEKMRCWEFLDKNKSYVHSNKITLPKSAFEAFKDYDLSFYGKGKYITGRIARNFWPTGVVPPEVSTDAKLVILKRKKRKTRKTSTQPIPSSSSRKASRKGRKKKTNSRPR
jgi:hypothetical protein